MDDGSAASLGNAAAFPAGGSFADGFAPLAAQFSAHLREGHEIGAGLTVYHRGRCVADLWGGAADVAGDIPWRRDTRAVVFSVTKGLAAMALALLGDRGKLEWDAPVSAVWPGFAEGGKGAITLRTLFNHRAGLPGLDETITLDDCVRPDRRAYLVRLLERQPPLWEPDRDQGYHAMTFGMYAGEVFERVAGEPMGEFLRRELFEPLDADVSLGTPASEDARIATLYPPSAGERMMHMIGRVLRGDSTETRVARALLSRESMTRRAFLNPRPGPQGLAEYNELRVRRAALPWVSATASAHGVARAYLPFASGGSFAGKQLLKPETIEPVTRRQGWSERDRVLQKPLGWSQGFLKEETTLFSPNPESFGHAGIGGSLGWCDPVRELTLGYVMNRLDWRVRSPRAVALCHALYRCEGVGA